MKSILMLVAALLLSAAPVLAEDATPAPSIMTPPSQSIEAVGSYAPLDLGNVARSYWSMNVYSTDNDAMIDNFLKITECSLFRQFYRNEFEWKKIRESARTYLEKYKNSFPRRFEYVQPLFLDRYDFQLKGFALMPESLFPPSTRLEIAAGGGDNKCGGVNILDLPGYPSGVVLNIRQPFALSFFRVNEDLAQEYLKMISSQPTDDKNGRPAYIRFRVRLDRYIGQETVGQASYGVFGGVLETIEIFGDRDLMFKIYEQSFY